MSKSKIPIWAKTRKGKYIVFPHHLLTALPDGKYGISTWAALNHWNEYYPVAHLFTESLDHAGFQFSVLKESESK